MFQIDFKNIFFNFIVFIMCLAFIFCLLMSFRVKTISEPVIKEKTIYVSDTTISLLRKEVDRMRDDIEYLKRKKSKLVIYCQPRENGTTDE